MRRDGKPKLFLASRLQLTPSSDWEQHSAISDGEGNFKCVLNIFSFLRIFCTIKQYGKNNEKSMKNDCFEMNLFFI